MKNIRKKFITFIVTIIFALYFPIVAIATINPVVDDANLLSKEEKENLISTIEEFRAEYNMDAVIVTSYNLDGKSPEEYSDDYYDYNGYGIDEDESGVLLLIDMDDRNIWISTKGKAESYFTDNRLDSIIEDIGKYLTNGQYYDASNIFLTDIKYYINEGVPEGQYTYSEEEYTTKVILIAIGVATVASIIGCILVCNSYKNSKSISSVNYVDKNSIVFTHKRDIFVNTFTTKTKIEKNNNSSGGNITTTHTSSSGSSHGGRGGKF